MKRRDLMTRLAKIAKQQGVDMDVREGGSHTVVRIGEKVQPVPRHSEITAKSIIEKMEGK